MICIHKYLYPQIRRLIPLHLLPQASCQRLCEELAIQEAAAGSILFRRGDEDLDWIYLLKGEISLEADGIVMERISGSSDAARFPLAHQVPRKVSARALTELQYVRIDQRRLKLMEHYQDEALRSGPEELKENPGDWMTRLFRSPVFQRLPASNLHKIVQRLKVIEVSCGDRLITQSEVGDCLYILRTGRAQVTRRPRPNAREIKLGELKPGDLFGEDALLSGQPRAVDVTMLTDGVVLRLDKEDFLSLVVEPVLQKLSFEAAWQEVEQGAVWLDVREPDSFHHRCLEGSLNIPFFSLRMQLGSLQRQRRYILVCEQGGQSQAAAFLLFRFGFEAAVLAGGLANVPAEYLVGEDAKLGTEPSKPKQGRLDRQESDDRSQTISDGKSQEAVEDADNWIEDLQAENKVLQQELAELRRAKQALEAKIAAQRFRIEELEEVIRQYCEAAQAEEAGEIVQALQTELAMIREQADQDVTAMRQEVEEMRQECKRLRVALANSESKPAATLPPALVAVDPEQLPLYLPEVTPTLPKARGAQVLWLLVGVLLSLASLGIGLQTESGRRWLLAWLQQDMPGVASIEIANQPAGQAGSDNPRRSVPKQNPPAPLDLIENSELESNDLFSQ